MLEFIIICTSIYIASRRMMRKKINEDKDVSMWQKKIKRYNKSPRQKNLTLSEYSNLIQDLEESGIDATGIELD